MFVFWFLESSIEAKARNIGTVFYFVFLIELLESEPQSPIKVSRVLLPIYLHTQLVLQWCRKRKEISDANMVTSPLNEVVKSLVSLH